MERAAGKTGHSAIIRPFRTLLKYRVRDHSVRVHKVRWSPYPKQELALSCPAKELFFGGAAGGGKTDFLIADFLQGAAKYGRKWHGIIFRQTTNQFGQIYKRCDFMLPAGTKFRKNWKGCTNVYILPNGATLQIAYLRYDKDVQNYQGNEYTWIAFDEMGNYTSDYAWTFMTSRARSSEGVPCYMRGTGNPGGPGQGWIRLRFMDGRTPGRIYLRHVVLPDNSETDITQCFIPSLLSDNPSLAKDSSYAATLAALPKYLRNAMLYGNWSDYTGNVFEVFNEATHVVKPFVLDSRYWYKFCALDWGWGKPYSLGFWAVNREGRLVKYRELYGCAPDEYNVGVKKGSDTLASEAMEYAMNEGINCIVVDPACANKQDNAPSVKENFEKAGWRVSLANNDRKNGLIMFNQYLANTDENGIPMLTVYGCCHDFIRTVPALTPDPHDNEDVNTDLEDHDYDESRYAVMSDFAQHPSRYVGRSSALDRRLVQTRSYNPLEEIDRETAIRETWDPSKEG